MPGYDRKLTVVVNPETLATPLRYRRLAPGAQGTGTAGIQGLSIDVNPFLGADHKSGNVVDSMLLTYRKALGNNDLVIYNWSMMVDSMDAAAKNALVAGDVRPWRVDDVAYRSVASILGAVSSKPAYSVFEYQAGPADYLAAVPAQPFYNPGWGTTTIEAHEIAQVIRAGNPTIRGIETWAVSPGTGDGVATKVRVEIYRNKLVPTGTRDADLEVMFRAEPDYANLAGHVEVSMDDFLSGYLDVDVDGIGVDDGGHERHVHKYTLVKNDFDEFWDRAGWEMRQSYMSGTLLVIPVKDPSGAVVEWAVYLHDPGQFFGLYSGDWNAYLRDHFLTAPVRPPPEDSTGSMSAEDGALLAITQAGIDRRNVIPVLFDQKDSAIEIVGKIVNAINANQRFLDSSMARVRRIGASMVVEHDAPGEVGTPRKLRGINGRWTFHDETSMPGTGDGKINTADGFHGYTVVFKGLKADDTPGTIKMRASRGNLLPGTHAFALNRTATLDVHTRDGDETGSDLDLQLVIGSKHDETITVNNKDVAVTRFGFKVTPGMLATLNPGRTEAGWSTYTGFGYSIVAGDPAVIGKVVVEVKAADGTTMKTFTSAFQNQSLLEAFHHVPGGFPARPASVNFTVHWLHEDPRYNETTVVALQGAWFEHESRSANVTLAYADGSTATIPLHAHPFAPASGFQTKLVRGLLDLDRDGTFASAGEVVIPKGTVTGIAITSKAIVDVRDLSLARSNVSVGDVAEVLHVSSFDSYEAHVRWLSWLTGSPGVEHPPAPWTATAGTFVETADTWVLQVAHDVNVDGKYDMVFSYEKGGNRPVFDAGPDGLPVLGDACEPTLKLDGWDERVAIDMDGDLLYDVTFHNYTVTSVESFGEMSTMVTRKVREAAQANEAGEFDHVVQVVETAMSRAIETRYIRNWTVAPGVTTGWWEVHEWGPPEWDTSSHAITEFMDTTGDGRYDTVFDHVDAWDDDPESGDWVYGIPVQDVIVDGLRTYETHALRVSANGGEFTMEWCDLEVSADFILINVDGETVLSMPVIVQRNVVVPVDPRGHMPVQVRSARGTIFWAKDENGAWTVGYVLPDQWNDGGNRVFNGLVTGDDDLDARYDEDRLPVAIGVVRDVNGNHVIELADPDDEHAYFDAFIPTYWLASEAGIHASIQTAYDSAWHDYRKSLAEPMFFWQTVIGSICTAVIIALAPTGIGAIIGFLVTMAIFYVYHQISNTIWSWVDELQDGLKVKGTELLNEGLGKSGEYPYPYITGTAHGILLPDDAVPPVLTWKQTLAGPDYFEENDAYAVNFRIPAYAERDALALAWLNFPTRLSGAVSSQVIAHEWHELYRSNGTARVELFSSASIDGFPSLMTTITDGLSTTSTSYGYGDSYSFTVRVTGPPVWDGRQASRPITAPLEVAWNYILGKASVAGSRELGEVDEVIQFTGTVSDPNLAIEAVRAEDGTVRLFALLRTTSREAEAQIRAASGGRFKGIVTTTGWDGRIQFVLSPSPSPGYRETLVEDEPGSIRDPWTRELLVPDWDTTGGANAHVLVDYNTVVMAALYQQSQAAASNAGLLGIFQGCDPRIWMVSMGIEIASTALSFSLSALLKRALPVKLFDKASRAMKRVFLEDSLYESVGAGFALKSNFLHNFLFKYLFWELVDEIVVEGFAKQVAVGVFGMPDEAAEQFGEAFSFALGILKDSLGRGGGGGRAQSRARQIAAQVKQLVQVQRNRLTAMMFNGGLTEGGRHAFLQALARSGSAQADALRDDARCNAQPDDASPDAEVVSASQDLAQAKAAGKAVVEGITAPVSADRLLVMKAHALLGEHLAAIEQGTEGAFAARVSGLQEGTRLAMRDFPSLGISRAVAMEGTVATLLAISKHASTILGRRVTFKELFTMPWVETIFGIDILHFMGMEVTLRDGTVATWDEVSEWAHDDFVARAGDITGVVVYDPAKRFKAKHVSKFRQGAMEAIHKTQGYTTRVGKINAYLQGKVSVADLPVAKQFAGALALRYFAMLDTESGSDELNEFMVMFDQLWLEFQDYWKQFPVGRLGSSWKPSVGFMETFLDELPVRRFTTEAVMRELATRLESLSQVHPSNLVPVGLVLTGGTPRFEFEYKHGNVQGTLYGSVHLAGDRAGQVTWDLWDELYTTHGMDSIDNIEEAIKALPTTAAGVVPASFTIRQPDGARQNVLCLAWEMPLDPQQANSPVGSFYRRLDRAPAPSVDLTYLHGYKFPGAQTFATFAGAIPVPQTYFGTGTAADPLVVARVVELARIAAWLQQQGVAVKGHTGAAKLDKLRFYVDGGDAGWVSVGVVFMKGTATPLHVEYIGGKQSNIVVPLLTERDGRGVEVKLGNGAVSWRPTDAGVTNLLYSMGVVHRKFDICGTDTDLTFCDWLRNHDVTADNVRILPMERQLQLFSAFLNGEVFQNVDLETGGVYRPGHIFLHWGQPGTGTPGQPLTATPWPDYQVPFSYPTPMPKPPTWTPVWRQHQTATGGALGAIWFA